MGEDWIPIKDQRRLIFQDLKPGDYALEVDVLEGGHNSDNDPFMLSIHKATPWWQLPIFYLILAALAIAGLYLFIKYREKNIKIKKNREIAINQKMAELEKKAVLAQMNPHFIFNSMNAIQYFMSQKDIESSMLFLSKFSRILRQVLKLSNAEFISISEEINLIKTYLEIEQFRHADKLKFQIQEVGAIPSNYQIRPFMIQPYIERIIVSTITDSGDTLDAKIQFELKNSVLFIMVNYLHSQEESPLGSLDDDETNSYSILEQRIKLSQKAEDQRILTKESFQDTKGIFNSKLVIQLETQQAK